MRGNKVLGIVFSNMHDSMLGELTENRTTGSVPFGGRYRMIDFVLSNLVNSDIRQVGIITKRNYQSLMDHVGAGRAWDLARKRGGLVILPPFATQGSGIYRGRLEALAGAMSYIRRSEAQYVLLCDSDIIANIDLREMIAEHARTAAQITMMYRQTQTCPENRRDAVSLVCSAEGEVFDVLTRPIDDGPHKLYMNVMLVDKAVLERMISEAQSRDQYSLIRHGIRGLLGKISIRAFQFDGYAYKIHNMKSYFSANMELLNPAVRRALFPKERPVFTKVLDQVPAKYGLSAQVRNSLVADGCIIEGEVENCIVFRGVKIGRGAKLRNCILMQNTVIGDHAHLEYVVTDKDVRIKDFRTLVGHESYPAYITKASIV